MRYFKTSIYAFLTLASLSHSQSAEKENLMVWEELRRILPEQPTYRLAESAPMITDIERSRSIDLGFSEIEKEAGFCFPESLKELHRKVGNLVFAPIFLPTPIGGVKSPLYELITKRKKKLPGEWVPFGEIDANELFAINYKTQEVSRFTLIPRLETGETSLTVAEWLRKAYLTH